MNSYQKHSTSKDWRDFWKEALNALPEVATDPLYILGKYDRVSIVLNKRNRTVTLVKDGVNQRVIILMRQIGKEEIEFTTNK